MPKLPEVEAVRRDFEKKIMNKKIVHDEVRNRIIKSNTSSALTAKFPFLKIVYWDTDGIWSDDYFVSLSVLTSRLLNAV